MEGTCHERIVFRSIAEYHQLGGTDTLAFLRQFGCFADCLTHHFHCIHVDAGLGGANIYGRTYEIGFRQSPWNCFNQSFVTCTETFVNQSAEAADEVDSYILCHPVQGLGILHRVAAAGSHQHGNRCDADSFIYDRNTVLLFDEFTGFHQVLGLAVNLVINLFAGLVDVAVTAVQERNTHGDGTDIQVFLLNHGYGFQYVIHVYHVVSTS